LEEIRKRMTEVEIKSWWRKIRNIKGIYNNYRHN
jgi:hypothetical protein